MPGAKSHTVTYEGTTDSSQNSAESVEIDGVTLEKGKPRDGLTADQVKRLEALPYHRFATGDSKDGDS